MVPVAIHRASNFEGGGASKSFGGCRAIQVKVSYDHSAQPRPQLRLERPPPRGGASFDPFSALGSLLNYFAKVD